jgi:hypothetical protein
MTVQAVSSALCLKACWSSSLVSATGGLKPWRWQGTQNCRLSVGKPGCGTNRSGTGPPWGRLVHSKMVAVLMRMLSPSVLSESQIGANPTVFFQFFLSGLTDLASCSALFMSTLLPSLARPPILHLYLVLSQIVWALLGSTLRFPADTTPMIGYPERLLQARYRACN